MTFGHILHGFFAKRKLIQRKLQVKLHTSIETPLSSLPSTGLPDLHGGSVQHSKSTPPEGYEENPQS